MTYKKYLLSLFYGLLLGISVPVFSQDLIIQKSLENPFDLYRVEDWASSKLFHYVKVNDLSISPSGILWIATSNGVVRYDGKSYTNFNRFNTPEIKNDQITAIYADSKERVWFGSYGNGLVCYSTGKFIKVKFSDDFEYRDVTAIDESPITEKIWLGSFGSGVAEISDDFKIRKYKPSDGLLSGDIRTIEAGTDSAVYIGTTRGLNILKNDKITSSTTQNGLPNNVVNSVEMDSDGNLWAGTQAGLAVRTNGKWYSVGAASGINIDIRKVKAISPQKILVLSSSGTFLYVREKFFSLQQSKNLYLNAVAVVVDRKNDILLGTGDRGIVGLKKHQQEYISGKIVSTGFTDNKKSFAAYKPDNWKRQNGLPHDRVNCVLQTSDGYLWLGTANGLARFDGDDFMIYNSFLTDEDKSNDIFELFEDRSGKLWIGTNGSGVYQFEKESIHSFEIGNGNNFQVISGFMEASDSSVWVSSLTEGIAVIRGDSTTYFNVENGLPNNNVRCMLQSKSGMIYIGTNSGLYQHDPMTKITSLIKGLPDQRIQAIAENDNGDLFVATFNGLSVIYSNRIENLTTKDGLPDNIIRRLHVDQDNKLWIVTRESGISVFENGKFLNFGEKDGLSSGLTTSIEIDRNKNVWIGTYNQGINRLTKRLFTTITISNGLQSNLVSAVLSDNDGSLWIGTYGSGLQRLKNDRISIYNKSGGLTDNYITALKKDRQNRLWIGTSNGLNVLDQSNLTQYDINSGLPATDITSLAEGRDGAIYIGTNSGGLTVFKNDEFKTYSRNDGLFSKSVKTLLLDKNNTLWIGTNGNGLFIMKNGKISRLKGLNQDGSENSKRNFTRIFNLYEGNDGSIYAALNNGDFLRIKNETEIVRFTIADLKSRPVLQLTEDSRGNFWAVSDVGIFLVNNSQLTDEQLIRIKNEIPYKRVASIHFTVRDGLADNGVMEHHSLVTMGPDGKLYFASQGGVSVLNTGLINFTAPAPDVRLDKFVFDDQPVLLDRSFTGYEIMNTSTKHEFHFSVVDLLGREKVQYRYRLLGLEDDWQLAANGDVIFYGRIPSGTYQFQIMACNISGMWNGKITSLQLTVKPQWWQTIWAFLGYVFIAVFGSMQVMKFQQKRMRIKLEEQMIREKEVSEKMVLHSEMNRKTKELDYARRD